MLADILKKIFGERTPRQYGNDKKIAGDPRMEPQGESFYKPVPGISGGARVLIPQGELRETTAPPRESFYKPLPDAAHEEIAGDRPAAVKPPSPAFSFFETAHYDRARCERAQDVAKNAGEAAERSISSSTAHLFIERPETKRGPIRGDDDERERAWIFVRDDPDFGPD